jgi:hypothetical protein
LTRVSEAASFVDINMVNGARICPVILFDGFKYATAFYLGWSPIGETRLGISSPASSARLMIAERRNRRKAGGQLDGVYI